MVVSLAATDDCNFSNTNSHPISRAINMRVLPSVKSRGHTDLYENCFRRYFTANARICTGHFSIVVTDTRVKGSFPYFFFFFYKICPSDKRRNSRYEVVACVQLVYEKKNHRSARPELTAMSGRCLLSKNETRPRI